MGVNATTERSTIKHIKSVIYSGNVSNFGHCDSPGDKIRFTIN
jgi:hypothetical protein